MDVAGLMGWAFGAGVLAAVNPCGFAILPGFVAHYLGPQVSPRGRARTSIHGVLVGLAVAAGKLTVFALVASVFLAGGRAVVRVAPWAGAGVGAVLVVVGLWVLAGHSLRVPLPALRAPVGAGYRSAYVFGLAYGTCSLACCLPIFLGVFLGIGGGVVGSVAGSAALFAAYALGVTAILVPLFVVTGNLRESLVARLRRLSRYTGPLTGALLALSGVVLVATWGPALAGSRDVGPLIGVVLAWQRWAQGFVLRLGPAVWAAVAACIVWIVVFSLVRARGASHTTEARPATPSEPLPPRRSAV